MARAVAVWVGLAVAVGAAAGAAGSERQTVSLNGAWAWRFADERGPWRPITIPGEIDFNADHPEAVFRRRFTAPPDLRGRDVRLRLLGVKYAHAVSLNGDPLGSYVGGYEPREYDVARHLRFDTPNELIVTVRDWRAALAPGAPAVRMNSPRFADDLNGLVRHPIGSMTGRWGIWQDVTLYAYRDVRIDDVFVRPSVSGKRLDVTVTLAGKAGPVPVTCEVRDGGRLVAALGTKTIAAPGSADFATSWDKPPLELWSPQHPKLYHLHVRVAGCDERSVRFGFREFAIRGPDFYLNGTKIHLLGTACHPTHGATRADAERVFRIARDAGCVAMRLHAQPWSHHLYDVADETGMLLIWESALWCYSPRYALATDAFWENAWAHVAAQMRLHRNRPSVVMWSAENELLLCGGDAVKRTEPELGRLADRMRALDPTRPIMFDGDADPDGKADVINLHYPHEYPRWQAFPNECWWIQKADGASKTSEVLETSEVADRGVVLDTYPRREWRWDRTKPLYIGEYLWVGSRNPHGHTVFFSDRAFIDPRRRYLQGKAAAWRYQIEAYRAAGVSGQCPWNIYEGSQELRLLVKAVTEKYKPVAAFVREYDSRFFPGDRVERTAVILNDTPTSADLTFRWALETGGRAAEKGEESVSLGPAGRTTVRFGFTCPDTPGPATLRWEVLAGDRSAPVYAESRDLRIVARAAVVKPSAALVVHDPAGRLTAWLKGRGIACAALNPRRPPEPAGTLLVVGPEAFAAPVGEVVVGRADSAGLAVARFVNAGGTAVVLRQRHLPPTLTSQTLVPTQCTIAFRRVPGSPLVAGVGDEDLTFWRGDHVVIDYPIRRPTRGPLIPIIDAGTTRGLRAVGLAEVARGAGRLVLCQMPVVAKADTDPIARRLLVNLLGTTPGKGAARRPLIALGATEEERDALQATGAIVETKASKIAPVILLGVAASAADIAQARRSAESGATVIIHDVTPERAAALGDLLPPGVLISDQVGLPVRLLRPVGLAQGLSNEQFYWLGQRPRVGWAEWPLSPSIAAHVLLPPAKAVGPVARVRGRDLKPHNRTLSRAYGDQMWMATNDVAECEADIAEAGTYEFSFDAGGTPAAGVYPSLELRIDGRPAGTVQLKGKGPTTCRLRADVTAGRRRFGVAFTNDVCTPTEDRNAFVAGLAWQRVEVQKAFEALTEPAVLVERTVGRGRIIIDQVRWHAAGDNTAKAGAYLSALLANLGVAFRTRTGWSIEAEAMDLPEQRHAIIQKRGGQVDFATAGRIETTVTFARGGRYVISIVAAGTPVESVYPICEVSVDGTPVGRAHLRSGGWQAYDVTATIAEGKRTLALAFVNDEWKPPEDRNLHLDRIILCPAD